MGWLFDGTWKAYTQPSIATSTSNTTLWYNSTFDYITTIDDPEQRLADALLEQMGNELTPGDVMTWHINEASEPAAEVVILQKRNHGKWEVRCIRPLNGSKLGIGTRFWANRDQLRTIQK